MVGAELKHLINEAAILAARRNRERSRSRTSTTPSRRSCSGRPGASSSPEDRRRTAYHEAGHALLGMLTPGADPVRKISIVPRGHALGVTFQSPDEDRYGYSESYLLGRIAGALGGRAAEELIYGEVTNGAESDLEQATRVARQMVGRWGMSPALGPVSVLPGPGEQPMFGFDGNQPAPATRDLLDAEVRRLLEEGAERARRTLTEHRSTSTPWSRRCSPPRRSTPPRPTGRPGSRRRTPHPRSVWTNPGRRSRTRRAAWRHRPGWAEALAGVSVSRLRRSAPGGQPRGTRGRRRGGRSRGRVGAPDRARRGRARPPER